MTRDIPVFTAVEQQQRSGRHTSGSPNGVGVDKLCDLRENAVQAINFLMSNGEHDGYMLWGHTIWQTMSEKSSGCPPPYRNYLPSTIHPLQDLQKFSQERSLKWWEGQGSSAYEHPGCEQTPAGWKVQQSFSKGAENCASRDKPQPLQTAKSCDPGQVTPLQQMRHVLVWLFSESK